MYARVVAGCAPCRVTQLTLGAAPQDPLTLKLRLDTNDAKASSVRRRRYALKVPAAHFYVEIVDRVPLPRCGGGGRGKGQMRLRLPLERICAQYGVRFFSPEKSKFVASTAKRQRGLQRGKPGSPLPCFASFCRSKRKAPAASGAYYDFAKGSVTPTGDHNLGLIFLLPTFLHRKVGPRRAGVQIMPLQKAFAAGRRLQTGPRIRIALCRNYPRTGFRFLSHP